MASWTTEFCEWYEGLHPACKVLVVLGGGAGGVLVATVAAPAIGAAVSAAGLGVAGGSLSGAAASSAGLAALGGGAIAANGAGVAGGTMVVAAVGGAAASGSAAVASNVISNSGARSREVLENAHRQDVQPGGIEFE